LLGGARQEQPQNIDPMAVDPQQPPQYDPRAYREAHDLKQRLAEYEHKFARIEKQSQQAQTQYISSAWNNFANATDQSGNQLYPFANDVKPAMNRLLANGEAKSIQEAYAKAAKPINDRIAAAAAAERSKAESERQVAIEKAKRAAPVKVSGMSRSGGKSFNNWEDAISAAIPS